MNAAMNYAELQVTSNFSFLRGGSHPDELVITAAALGLTAVAITDRNSLAGVVRATDFTRLLEDDRWEADGKMGLQGTWPRKKARAW